MKNILLFIKDFELGSKVSSACVDYEMNVEFCDENTSPDDFANKSVLAIIDLDEDTIVWVIKFGYLSIESFSLSSLKAAGLLRTLTPKFKAASKI